MQSVLHRNAARLAPTRGVLSKRGGTDVLIDGEDVLGVIEEKRRSAKLA